MMIYYTQGTGRSLGSQYSLQESVLKIIFSPLFPVLEYCVFPCMNCKVRYEITIENYTVLVQTPSISAELAHSLFLKYSPEANTGS